MSSQRKTPTKGKVPGRDLAAAPERVLPLSLTDIAEQLSEEIAWFSAVVDARFRHYFTGDDEAVDPREIAPPECPAAPNPYGTLVRQFATDWDERLLLALALAPHVAPHALDVFFIKNDKIDRGFTEFGGIKGIHHAGFLPTGDTALFLLCGDDMAGRFEAVSRFDPERPLFAQGVLRLATPQPDEPPWSGSLSFSAGHFRSLLTGEEPRPEHGAQFPAHRITTRLTWEDLVLDPVTLGEVREIAAWARHERQLLDDWGLGRHVKRGFRALFHGPSGTGKTLTATLLGKELGVDVYRIDLSQVVSKYIGETEKNLATVFAEAGRRNWILFFDEADALFGKRTQTSNAHDRYANQEVAYLLQRIEDHGGIVILATNLKSNLDDAFRRRFQLTVYFASPDADLRRRLWQNALGPSVPLAEDVDLAKLARDHELTGGQIVTVIQKSSLMAVQDTRQQVNLQHIQRAIRMVNREFGRA